MLGGPNILHSAGSPDRQGGSQLLHLSFSESGFFFFLQATGQFLLCARPCAIATGKQLQN